MLVTVTKYPGEKAQGENGYFCPQFQSFIPRWLPCFVQKAEPRAAHLTEAGMQGMVVMGADRVGEVLGV